MEYITIADIDRTGYYQLNYNLFNNKFYQTKIKKYKTIVKKGVSEKVEVTILRDNLSDTSKILYGILCNQLKRSLENGWFDENRRIYVKFSLEKLCMTLNKSRDTIVTCKKELEKNGLLEIVDGGQGKADTFYIGKVKDKPLEDIEMEFLDKTAKIEDSEKPVETFDQSKTSPQPVEKFDSKPVETFDSIYYSNITNISTTTSSSGYEFLKKYKIETATRLNIIKNIKNLSEEHFIKIYSLVEKEQGNGTIKNFNAVLYKALKGEWAFSTTPSSSMSSEDIRRKVKKLCNYWIDAPLPITDRINKFLEDVKEFPSDLVSEYRDKMLNYFRNQEGA